MNKILISFLILILLSGCGAATSFRGTASGLSSQTSPDSNQSKNGGSTTSSQVSGSNSSGSTSNSGNPTAGTIIQGATTSQSPSPSSNSNPTPSAVSNVLCHIPPGNPANRMEIPAADPSYPAHLAHGDSMGGCH